MSTIVRTPVRKRDSRHFLVDGLQVWAAHLDTFEGRPFGVRFWWMESQFSTSPLNHITQDQGSTYQPFESFIGVSGGIDMRISEFETNPERLKRLERIWFELKQEEMKSHEHEPYTSVEF